MELNQGLVLLQKTNKNLAEFFLNLSSEKINIGCTLGVNPKSLTLTSGGRVEKSFMNTLLSERKLNSVYTSVLQ